MADDLVQTPAKRKAGDDENTKRSVRRKASEAPKHGAETITVHVGLGAARHTFSAHKDLIAKHSDFVKAAMNNDLKESKQRTINLVDHDREGFEIFYQFLYTGHIFSSKDGDYQKIKDNPTHTHTDTEWSRLRDAWVLGGKLMSTSFKDAIVDALISKINTTNRFPTTLHEDIYPKSTKQSRMRKLLVELTIWSWHPGDLTTRIFRVDSAEFFFDLVVAMASIKQTDRQGESPYKGEDTCLYHEHEAEGKVCYKTMF